MQLKSNRLIKVIYAAITLSLLLGIRQIERQEKFFSEYFSPSDPKTIYRVDRADDTSGLDEEAVRYVVFSGTRPEIIKTAPVIRALKKADLNVHVVFTGQHPDIAAPFREFWDIHFDTILTGVFRSGQPLSSLTGNLLMEIERSIPARKADVWIVQGDTSTVFAAGTVAFLRGTPVVHLEAGLRTFDHSSPFPEEFHRRSTALATSLHIAPTQLSRDRLVAEGVDPLRVVVMGNSGMDATRLAQPHLRPPAELDLSAPTRLVLVTLHRRENALHLFDLYQAMGQLNARNLTFIVPVHPNPAATAAANLACDTYTEIMHCVKPLGYAETQWMMKHAEMVITDSGGLQEEATWYGCPVLVLRGTTERPEGIDAGSSLLVPNASVLRSLLPSLLQEPQSDALRAMQILSYPFGDGHTADRLVDYLQLNSTQALLKKPIQMVEQRAESKKLLPCEQAVPWEACTVEGTSLDVILSVYKRGASLPEQLTKLREQSLLPQHVYVVQNEHHTNVTQLVRQWQAEHDPTEAIFPIDVISSTVNTKYHGRFHFAYAVSNATYVSIWDDDVIPGPDWLKYNIEFSRSHGDCLVGGNGRTLDRINSNHSCIVQGGEKSAPGGLVDFVGHTWTLRREFLRYYVGMHPYTYSTGEDIQLAFVLQKHGISAYSPPQSGTQTLQDSSYTTDENAGYRKPQDARQWLLFKVLEQGFKPIKCQNCSPENVRNSLGRIKDWSIVPAICT